MPECLPDLPRYIRNTDAFGWQGADHPDGPWRSIPAPQSGLPWTTDGPAAQSREPASVAPEATGPRPLSPAAQAIVQAFDDRYELCGSFDDNWQELCAARWRPWRPWPIRWRRCRTRPTRSGSLTGQIGRSPSASASSASPPSWRAAMAEPSYSDRLALAVCRGGALPEYPCAAPCDQCRRDSAAVAAELAQILRERHGGSSGTADWIDGIGCHA